MSESQVPSPPPGPPKLWQTMMSVLASFFGVQSRRNRERDFTQGRASHFVVLGLLATLMFILTVWGAVKLALHLAAR